MKKIDKLAEFKKEKDKLNNLFKDADEAQRKLAEGIVEETAYFKSELCYMREILEETGMIILHPNDITKQKSLPIANEYRRTANMYSLNIKVLNSILMKNEPDEEDPLGVWLAEKRH